MDRISGNAAFTLIRLIGFVLLGLVGFFLSFQASAKSIDSVSSELFTQVGDSAFWEAKVKCEGESTAIVIRQKLKQDDWCVEGGQLPCKKTKLKMAEDVCLNILSLTKSVAKSLRPTVPVKQVQQSSNTAKLATAEQQRISRERRLAGIKAKQEVMEKREREQRAMVLALNEEKRALAEERLSLNREKLEVEQIELRLSDRAKEVEMQLLSLDD